MMQPNSRFTGLLAREQPMLLDGGLATQLEAQGCDIGNELWSASLLQSNPDAIVAAHHAYLNVGAECLATASYQASREGFAKTGMSHDEADALMLLSVALAKRARKEAGSDAAIAASLGPYGAMLHDGSEYRGDYGVPSQVLNDFHEPRLRLFDAAGIDVIALETIPSMQEAQVLVELLKDCRTPSWLSFSCPNDNEISDGTPIVDVADLFAEHPGVVAGAKIVGGCCRMGPAHIAAMAAMIDESLPQ